MNNDNDSFISALSSDAPAAPSTVHPLLVREKELWERYQVFSLTKHGDADITNRVFPCLWGYIMARVVDREANQYDTDPLSATELLDIIDDSLSLVEREQSTVKTD